MEDLFQNQIEENAPLADRMRPRTLDEFIGQKHIVGEGKLLRRAILTDRLQSSIFFGPPGTGKTTLAAIVANATGGAFAKLNAVTAGVKELRAIVEEAENRLRLYRQRMVPRNLLRVLDTVEHPTGLMRDDRCAAVHQLRRMAHRRAVQLRERLMPEAHA